MINGKFWLRKIDWGDTTCSGFKIILQKIQQNDRLKEKETKKRKKNLVISQCLRIANKKVQSLK